MLRPIDRSRHWRPGRGTWWLACSCLLGAALTGPGALADDRPNVLLVIADDWGHPNAGAYGDRAVRTPNFDRLAAEGVRFERSYCASPSCTPSRGGLLTGQAIHRLEAGGNLWSALAARFKGYPDYLEAAGYVVGLTGKGWGPGSLEGTGRTRNPAGPNFKSFAAFLETVPADRPFCYWYGSTDPHRPYAAGSGRTAGLDPAGVRIPAYWPDDPVVRSDVLDYYGEVESFDRQVGQLLETLARSGRAENTIVVVTSDNGMPFPRCKANLYDGGTHMPLAIRWPAKIKGGTVVDAFVSHTDLAPTFLEAAGVPVPDDMTGRSLLPLLRGETQAGRDAVFVERERHANVRKGDLSYPSRAIRTRDYLLIRNLRADRWPAGDPEKWLSVGPFGDTDGGPSKDLLLDRRSDPAIRSFFELCFERRPEVELYDLRVDPDQVRNVAGQPEHAEVQKQLEARLEEWRTRTADPLLTSGDDEPFDHYEYFGERNVPRPRR